MEYKYLRDVNLEKNINSRVFIIFMARDVDIRIQKDGVSKYIALNMFDRDKKVSAKKFGVNDKEIEELKNGMVYRGAVDVKEYKGAASCILYNFEKHNENPANFIRWADGMDEAQNIIQDALNIISESIYKNIVYDILTEAWAKFVRWTAASSVHHESMGGLLVHTAEVINQGNQIADLWEEKYGPGFINKPLLLSAALLHDIGKIQELNVDMMSGSTEYSTEASLETHITICASLIDIAAYKYQLGYQKYRINELNEQEPIKTIDELEYEKESVKLLKHCILSHHGKLEYGSPIEPHIPEATILSVADGLSSEMFRYNKEFKELDCGKSSTNWVSGKLSVVYKDLTKD